MKNMYNTKFKYQHKDLLDISTEEHTDWNHPLVMWCCWLNNKTQPIRKPVPLITKGSLLEDWWSCGFTSYSTQNRSFRRRPQANLLAWYGKTKPNTTKAHIYQSKEMYNNTKQTQKN